MTGLTLTEARNVEEVLIHLEESCEDARNDHMATVIEPTMRRENVEEFCKNIRKALG